MTEWNAELEVASRGRNLVLCLDGTGNTFGTVNTNVVRAAQVMARNGGQVLYYDPGVGTLPDPRLLTRLGQWFSRAVDLAFATSLTRNAGEAYAWLMRMWRPGDRIFLFGFSRGAYTARLVAAMLHHVGLLPEGSENLIPYAIQIQRGVGRNASLAVGDEFRRLFARPTASDGRVPVRFLGLWDTVLSVGWIWNQAKYRFTTNNPSLEAARQAISLDERRAFYRQNRLKAVHREIRQLWFPGVHSDVGGGYADSRLWQPAFRWVMQGAQDCGLVIEKAALDAMAPPQSDAWNDKRHTEMTNPLWWIAEFVPKWHWNGKRYTPRVNLFRLRKLTEEDTLHEAVLRRIHSGSYEPGNLSRAFRERVRSLNPGDIPPELAYRP